MAGIIEVKDQGKVRIYDADNSNYVDIVVPSTVSSNRTITLPDASFTVPQETNATHSGEVTGATALTIADNIVDEANLKVSNSPTNGYALTAQSGNTGGLTWAAAGLDGWSSNSGNLLPADASKGIYLGVNSATAANLLDDYEEGTYTPVVTFGGGSSGITYNSGATSGIYTKVGRMVLVSINITMTSKGSSSGTAEVSLPFTPTSFLAGHNHAQYGMASRLQHLSVAAAGMAFRVRADSAKAYFQPMRSGTSPLTTYGDNSDFANNTTLSATLIYATS